MWMNDYGDDVYYPNHNSLHFGELSMGVNSDKVVFNSRDRRVNVYMVVLIVFIYVAF